MQPIRFGGYNVATIKVVVQGLNGFVVMMHSVRTGKIGPKVEYKLPAGRPVEPLAAAVDLNHIYNLNNVLGEDERLVVHEHTLRRDSVSLVNGSGDTVETVYRRGRKVKLVDKELPLPESKLFTLPHFRKKAVHHEQELEKFKSVSLPLIKKKLVIAPPDTEFGWLKRTVDYLAKLKK